AHHNDWDTLAQRSESSSSITSSSDTKIIAPKAEMAEINKNLMRILQVNQQVKAVTPNCETCGGTHSFNDCPSTVGNTQNVYAAGAYQAHNSFDPAPTCQTMASVQIKSDPAPECQTMALEHGSLSPEHNCQENVTHGDKTVLAASAYFLWRERNLRLFQKKTMTVDQLVRIICDTIRLKLITFRFKKMSTGSRLLLDQWRVPSYCIVRDGSAGSCPNEAKARKIELKLGISSEEEKGKDL
nr:RNA-directed DNA polymerase, eukaryota, reverse transcriptase zinc-binding domain protein [Tanacetum cinerariifolium]